MNSMRTTFKIGDWVTRVTRSDDLLDTPTRWDGTVVDIIPDFIEGSDESLYRVYWRFPKGKVADYRTGELSRVRRNFARSAA